MQLSTLCRCQGFFCSIHSSPMVQTCHLLCFTTPSASSSKSRSLVDSTSVPSPCDVAWKFSQGSELGHSLGSLHLFQESLPSLLEVFCLENKFLMCFICFVLACFRQVNHYLLLHLARSRLHRAFAGAVECLECSPSSFVCCFLLILPLSV